jgi:DNA polymerase-1
VYIVVSPGRARAFDEGGAALSDEQVVDLPAFIREHSDARWVWDDTRRWYPELLAAGLRVERCVDLRLSHAILRHSSLTAGSELARAAPGTWDEAPVLEEPRDRGTALFDLEEPAPRAEADPADEWMRQRAAVASSTDPGRLGLLLAAESAGALIACEMEHFGLPLDSKTHEKLLEELLGPRPKHGERPAKLEALKQVLVEKLETELNPDSPADLLKALQRAGLQVKSTSRWELREIEHPVIEPLIQYKKLSRLMTANGWNWLETWVADGRFRPEYVPGGVVTGRWAASGGGALQLPKQIRGAVVADAGWKFVVADAAQLEPRVLAALSRDKAMAKAGEGDMYEGIVASGAVATRAQAKIAMLGAMYGATTGESGRLLPALGKAFPQALALVEQAARAGERGEVVTTHLGRSSPPPQQNWAAESAIDAAAENRARSQARSWGRFTRNFIVQGTAAEWALCWMAGLRGALWTMADAAPALRPHLVFFLHDEVIVHTPAELAEQVAASIRQAAAEAGRLLFGDLPVTFPVTTAIVDNYGEAK